MPRRPKRPSRSNWHFWLGAWLLAWSACSIAQPDTEPQLEAAYLVNFMKYIEWPANNRSTATICLFGRDTLGAQLSNYEGRTVGGRELHTRRVNSPDDMDGCQVLFIPDVEEARIGVILRWIRGAAVVAVSDSDGFARAGGSIELVRGNGSMQFIVNLDALARSGLRASSQMLRLALRVIGNER